MSKRHHARAVLSIEPSQRELPAGGGVCVPQPLEVRVFEVLVTLEMTALLLLAVGTVQLLSELDGAPEAELGQRAWAAARFGMAEAGALGPLFKHLVRASRHGLRQAHVMQERIRGHRLQRERRGPLGPVLSLWERRRVQRSEELVELAHLVEQLEQMSTALARYRAGTGRLLDLTVPLKCVQAERD